MRALEVVALSIVLALSGGGTKRQHVCPVELSFTNYPVSGATLQEVRAAMRAHGPRDESGDRRFATAEWRVHWSWKPAATGGIDPESVELRCTATIRMPELAWPKVLDGLEEARWAEYRQRLLQHEMNHVRHAERLAPEIRGRIQAWARHAGSVSAERAQSIARGVVREMRALDRAYDRRTRHGRTEGL